MTAETQKQQGDIGYEILSAEAGRRMHDNFIASLEAKAKKALPAQVPEAEALLAALKKLLIAAARKGIDLKAADLAGLAEAGREEVEKRREEMESRLHAGSPDTSKFPSPEFSPEQRKKIAAAAKKRKEDPAVLEALGGEERVYLRLKGAVDVPVSDTQKEVAACLEKLGYRVLDYTQGYATDEKGKQQFKIGKLLKGEAKLADHFRDDASRTTGALLAVISRNADDIARMSTGRAWSSCMGSGGLHFDQYVPKDVQEGSLVAYLVSEKDPDIINPLARIMIKPFVEKRSPKNVLTSIAKLAFGRPAGRAEIFFPNKTYGIPNQTFPAVVARFLEEKLNAGKTGEFALPEKLYADGLAPVQIRKDGKTLPSFGLSIRV